MSFCLLCHLCVLPGSLIVVLWVSLFTHTDSLLADCFVLRLQQLGLTGDSGLLAPLHRAGLIPDFTCVQLVLMVAAICALCDGLCALCCFSPTAVQRHHSRLGDQKLSLSVVAINLLSSGCND